MIADQSTEALETLAREYGGTICSRRPADDLGKDVPLYEYTWNHLTLHALKVDASITYLPTAC